MWREDSGRDVRSFEASGGRLAWREVGSGPPLVWIHGFPLTSAVFSSQISIPGVRHILPDLAGFGASPPAHGIVEIEDYATGLVTLLDHVRVDRFIVAGLSMGGYVALALQRLVAGRVAGMILVDTRANADSREIRRARLETIAEVESLGLDPLIERMSSKLVADPSLYESVREIMRGSTREGVIAALHAMANRSDATAQLSSLDAPVLVIAGELDEITPPVVARGMAEVIPTARLLEIPGAGHLSLLEAPDLFNDAVTTWIEEAIGDGLQ